MQLENHLILEDTLIKEALLKINKIGNPDLLTLFVVDSENKLLGSLTDGDIRRGLINGIDIGNSIKKVYHKDVKYVVDDKSPDYEKMNYLRSEKVKLVPLVNKQNQILKLLDFSVQKVILPIDAVIMAGGLGSRLKPLTDSTPKPLLKVGDKEIIAHNFDRLYQFGVTNQFVTVNYLGEQIVSFCKSYKKEINFNLIQEKEYYGTAGALSLINDFQNDTILLMNSDLLTNIDYEDFYKSFIDKEADIMVASVPYQVSLPYGIFKEENRKVLSFEEKPNYTYYANAGIYLIKKSLLKLVPENEFFNATDLLEIIINSNKKLIHYPIRSYWLDIGKHEDYKKAQNDILHIDFD
mgnify:CR=1 FL=1